MIVSEMLGTFQRIINMDKILIISNNAISNTESNGRIYSYLVNEYLPDNICNFYVRGNPDIEGVDYLTVSPKKALLSKITFGILKSKNAHIEQSHSSTMGSSKSKKVFFHVLRNFAFYRNKSILNLLEKEILDQKINVIYLWGSNIPYLYRYAWKLAKKLNLKLVTFTGEDYPLKKYNYISFKRSIFFSGFQKKLRKSAEIVYKISSCNMFSNDELRDFYKDSFHLENAETVYLKSPLTELQQITASNDTFNILYGGNLYNERIKSIIDIASYCKKYENVKILIYGQGNNEALEQLEKFPNIEYKGVLPYNKLINEIKKANLLLHVEGFSDFYKMDCKFAFSTKISDYFMINLPFFAYGPEEISGIKFCRKLIPDFTASSWDELNKLDAIILNKKKFVVDYNKVKECFEIKAKNL